MSDEPRLMLDIVGRRLPWDWRYHMPRNPLALRGRRVKIIVEGVVTGAMGRTVGGEHQITVFIEADEAHVVKVFPLAKPGGGGSEPE